MLIIQFSAIAALLINIATAKVFTKCELAKELSEIHRIPSHEIGTYVCIAERQSGLNTQTVVQGLYYGMFQMSSEFWCDIYGRGKECNLNCNDLLNDDISDDMRCAQEIVKEHQRLSGNGFSAWPSGASCLALGNSYISECSLGSKAINYQQNNFNSIKPYSVTDHKKKSGKGKIFGRCELAKELSEVYRIASQEIGTYVCLAERQSGLNTQAIGDGMYYGMYQISSEFWCDAYGHGKGCNVNCNDLLDDDLSDDLQCMKTIIEEHQRFSGNGFSAWPSGTSCQAQGNSYIADCSIESNHISTTYYNNNNNNNNRKVASAQRKSSGNVGKGKVYERCELARELKYKHSLPMEHIATWVCIAKHESNYDTSAVGRLNWDGSEDHGLFQISDIYWCGPSGKGCGLSCDELKDNDITNDVECIKTIHKEHTRLSGDGFTAWAVYPRCKGQADSYISGCFDDSENEIIPYKPKPGVTQPSYSVHHKSKTSVGTGKVYERCELARELRDKHKLPAHQIATWVCIAKYESNYNTSAIGRLNWDGSEDHGLFQISDIYWCGANGKACNAQCSDFEDNDISNDIECIRTIHDEHTRLSGDGFNAWTVYKQKCRGKSETFIKGCFDDNANEIVPFKPKPGVQQHNKNQYSKTSSHGKIPGKGKVYERCELANELRYKFKIPMEQIATWVCIAKHESNFNTSAIGRLNWDGSEDHGLFQISDIYWCSPPGQGKGCGLSCAELEDNDISDDVECMLKIHEEHTLLSGDGFNAWAVYRPHCQGRSESYLNGCFDGDNNDIPHGQLPVTQPTTRRVTTTTTYRTVPTTTYRTTPTTTTTYRTAPKTTTTYRTIPTTTTSTTTYRTVPTTTRTYQTTKYVPQVTTTYRNIDTTLLDTTIRSEAFTTNKIFTQPKTTSSLLKKSSLTPKNVNSSPTIKPFNIFDLYFNSFPSQKSILTPQQKSSADKPSTSKVQTTKSSTIGQKSSYTTTKTYQVPSTVKSVYINSQLPNINHKASTTKKSITQSVKPTTIVQQTTKRTTPITTTARNSIATTTTRKSTVQTVNNSQSTSKGSAVQPFNVFSYYLTDYTSKSPPINYKPIQFNDKSAIIFKKSENYASQPVSGSSSAINSFKSSTEKTNFKSNIAENFASTKPSSFLNQFPSHYNSGVNHNRIGRLITPYSFEYLLQLTTPKTPRTIYG